MSTNIPIQLFKVAVSAFVVREHTILLLKRAEDDAFLPGRWEVPGGSVEEGETIEAAIIRETREEAGLSVTPFKLLSYFEYQDGQGRRTINLNFLCQLQDHATEADTGVGEMAEARWLREPEFSSIPFTSTTMMEACRTALTHGV